VPESDSETRGSGDPSHIAYFAWSCNAYRNPWRDTIDSVFDRLPPRGPATRHRCGKPVTRELREELQERAANLGALTLE